MNRRPSAGQVAAMGRIARVVVPGLPQHPPCRARSEKPRREDQRPADSGMAVRSASVAVGRAGRGRRGDPQAHADRPAAGRSTVRQEAGASGWSLPPGRTGEAHGRRPVGCWVLPERARPCQVIPLIRNDPRQPSNRRRAPAGAVDKALERRNPLHAPAGGIGSRMDGYGPGRPGQDGPSDGLPHEDRLVEVTDHARFDQPS